MRAFENLSTEPELGAALTAALRTELARRGADAGEVCSTVIEGDVRATDPSPTSPTSAATAGTAPSSGAAQARGGTWRIGLEVRARLVAGRAAV